MARRLGTISVAKHITAMERGDGTMQDQILQVDENMLGTNPSASITR